MGQRAQWGDEPWGALPGGQMVHVRRSADPRAAARRRRDEEQWRREEQERKLELERRHAR